MRQPFLAKLAILAALSGAFTAPAVAQAVAPSNTTAPTDMLHGNPNGPNWLEKFDPSKSQANAWGAMGTMQMMPMMQNGMMQMMDGHAQMRNMPKMMAQMPSTRCCAKTLNARPEHTHIHA
jgi:hypothetical protein